MFGTLTIWLCLLPSSLLGLLGAWIFSIPWVAVKFMDTPTERSSHFVPTPKGGGVGILMAFVWTAFVLEIGIAFYMPVVIFGVLGLLSDQLDTGPALRLFLQCCVSFFFIGIFKDVLNVDSNSIWYGFASIPVILFWSIFITGSANFYNFMDGINGIAALTGIIAFSFVLLFRFLFFVVDDVAILSFSTAMACLGFLPMNFPSARVFMGDVGSVMLGAFWGVLVFVHSTSLNVFLVYVSFMFPFYSDELTTMALRLGNGENLFKPHRKHLYQILVNEGSTSHLMVTILYATVQTVVGSLMMILYKYDSLALLVVTLVMFFICFSLFSWNVRQIQKTGMDNA